MTKENRPDAGDVWCGCDGEGMAHIPWSKGFVCGEGPAATEIRAQRREMAAWKGRFDGLNIIIKQLESKIADLKQELNRKNSLLDATEERLCIWEKEFGGVRVTTIKDGKAIGQTALEVVNGSAQDASALFRRNAIEILAEQQAKEIAALKQELAFAKGEAKLYHVDMDLWREQIMIDTGLKKEIATLKSSLEAHRAWLAKALTHTCCESARGYSASHNMSCAALDLINKDFMDKSE